MALVLDEGRTIASVAPSLGVGESNLGNWVRQARLDRGEREGLTSGERAELRRENAQLRTGARSALTSGGLVGDRVGTAARYRWVAGRRAEGFPAKLCCGAAGVSRQAFYAHQARQAAGPTRRERAEAESVRFSV